MQAIRVEHSYHNFASDHKRRCYGDDTDTSLSLSDQNSVNSINDLDVSQDVPERQYDMTPQDLVANFTQTLIDKSLLDPGEIDWALNLWVKYTICWMYLKMGFNTDIIYAVLWSSGFKVWYLCNKLSHHIE